jgi:hypothetical protein
MTAGRRLGQVAGGGCSGLFGVAGPGGGVPCGCLAGATWFDHACWARCETLAASGVRRGSFRRQANVSILHVVFPRTKLCMLLLPSRGKCLQRLRHHLVAAPQRRQLADRARQAC